MLLRWSPPGAFIEANRLAFVTDPLPASPTQRRQVRPEIGEPPSRKSISLSLEATYRMIN